MSAPLSPDFANGEVSFWYRSIGVPEPGEPLDGDLQADVAIVAPDIRACGPPTT